MESSKGKPLDAWAAPSYESSSWMKPNNIHHRIVLYTGLALYAYYIHGRIVYMNYTTITFTRAIPAMCRYLSPGMEYISEDF